jgi:hypothetical protein
MNVMTGNISQNEIFIDITDSEDNELDQQSGDDVMICTDNEEDTEHERNDEEIADAEETGLNIPVMRRNFTLKFKLKAINYLKSDKINYNKNKAQKHSKSDLGRYVSRQLFQNWLKQEPELLILKDDRSINFSRKRNLNKNKVPFFPNIDKKTLEKIKRRRELGLQVSDADIKQFSIEALEDLKIERPVCKELNFRASNGWRYGFKQRNNIVLREATSVGQKIPDNAKEIALEFFDYNNEWLKKNESEQVFIANMDEIPMYFDVPGNKTYDFKRVQTVKIKTTGKEKLRFTLVLCIFSDGRITDAMIIFKNLKNPPRPAKGETWPNDVFVTASKGGSMSEELMRLWIQKVWAKRRGFFSNATGRTLLVMDAHRAHTTAGIRNNLKRNYKTDVSIIPGGMTPLLQPLDLSVNRPVKAIFSKKWTNWMASATEQYNQTGLKPKVTYTMIVNWVHDVINQLDPQIIINSFRYCGLNANKSEIQYHSKLLDVLTTGQLSAINSEDPESTGMTDDEEEIENEEIELVDENDI